jgi:hypothetical protein
VKDNAGIIFYEKDKEIANIESPNALPMLTEGKWWELYVAKVVCNWNKRSNKDRDVWLNVKFVPKSNADSTSNLPKNEVDILVNLGTKFLFIECKSGKIGEDNIYRTRSVKDTYGGQMSKVVLISFYPLTPLILEKAKENHVEVIASNNLSTLNGYIATELDKIVGQKGI